MKKKYQRIPNLKVRSCIFAKPSEFYRAQVHYNENGKVNFWADFLDYSENHFVVVRPTLFALFKVIEFEGERGWFIRYWRGNFLELLTTFPCKLAFISFCRDDNITRICDFEDTWNLAHTIASRKVGKICSAA